jgi:hypothetical protein
MTETATASTGPSPDTDLMAHPADILMNLLVLLLAPMFLTASGADIGYARLAAFETINAYQARSQADLIAVAQIVACGLAALGSLSLSMTDDLSLPMILRLRGNANALNRSAEQNRRALSQSRYDGNPVSESPFTGADAMYEAQVLASVADTRKRIDAARARPPSVEAPPPAAPPKTSAATPIDRQSQVIWTAAMNEVAEEYTAGIHNLPPAQHKAASLRTAALSSSANVLLAGAIAPLPQPGALSAVIRPKPPEHRF